MSTADTAINVTEFVARSASYGEGALPVARFIASWFPGGGAVLDAVEIAMPIIQKISAAAPQAVKVIEAGRPVLDAIDKSSPDLVANMKALLAIAINHDPARPETAMTAAGVSDAEVEKFSSIVFTPGRTNEEQQREWDRAQGQS